MWSAVAFAGVAGATAVVLAQAPGGHQATAEPGKQAATMTQGGMRMMMQRSADSDRKLAELVIRMNAARGDQKVAAIADVVTELVAERKQMHEQMRMQAEMMERMMSMHGTGGMMNKAPSQAPVPTPAPQGDEHSTHHPEQR
jgi:hypothetical protein